MDNSNKGIISVKYVCTYFNTVTLHLYYYRDDNKYTFKLKIM